MNKRGGFTLLELLLVIFIIGILATAALTTFGPQVRSGAYLAEARSNISVIRSASEAYFQQFGTYPTSLTDITTQGATGSTQVALVSNPNVAGSRWSYSLTGSGTAYSVVATKSDAPFAGATVTIDNTGKETRSGGI